MSNNYQPRFKFLSLSSVAVNQSGLTLIEIMVSLVISLFLIAGVIQLFVSSKQTYRSQDALSRIQENGRMAMEGMAADIRMAGYAPPGIVLPTAAIAGNSASVQISGNTIPRDNITVSWVDNSNQSRIYAIATSSNTPDCANAGTALTLNANGGGVQELVEGVEGMRVLYGSCSPVDVDGNGINDSMVVTSPFYQQASNVSNWNSVCSIRVHLLMASLTDNVVKQPQTIYFPADTNTALTFNDHCLRQTFAFTIQLRNRVP